MTTANPGGVGLDVGPEPEPGTQADLRDGAARAGRPPLGSGLAAGWRSVREALDKPLASYYLLLGSSALLLTIGLIMVLSASSVRSYLTSHGVPDTVITSQAFGETMPRVPTADGVRELQNRRVEITYGPGSGF